ncbi:uncharacterized protein LOC123201917 [Mangifera indica]|uniref:uncharacterized protein LOC123201917 n=1 Tax=Mangifera indica TaxID=29780 RepID=UPI001CFC1308|nr:uncharacterized protein LOC123201917 [Mangifera indica]
MEKLAKVESFSSLVLSKPSLSFVAAVFLLPSLVFTYLPGSGFSHFVVTVTIPILILSTSILVTFTKKKKEITLLENQVQDGKSRWDLAGDLAEKKAERKQQEEIQNVAEEKAAKEREVVGLTREPAGILMNSRDSVSEGDEDEDEDGLIEITIPNSKPSEFLPQSIFYQQGLMELLADINGVNEEEENLIEIDISMGSIKYSRFEIEA